MLARTPCGDSADLSRLPPAPLGCRHNKASGDGGKAGKVIPAQQIVKLEIGEFEARRRDAVTPFAMGSEPYRLRLAESARPGSLANGG